MKSKIVFSFFITMFSPYILATELSCSHYFHTNIHDVSAEIIIWQQNINIELGKNDKLLHELLEKNQRISSEILKNLNNHQDNLAKTKLEQVLLRKINKADNLSDIAKQFGRSALIEKDLISTKHDEYSDIEFKLISKIEYNEKDELIINEALQLNVTNNLSHVQRNYYHFLNEYALMTLDSYQKTLNLYRIELEQFKIKNPLYGELQAVSYKCIYPSKIQTSAQNEQELLKIISNSQKKLQELRLKNKEQEANVHINDNEHTPPLEINNLNTSSK